MMSCLEMIANVRCSVFSTLTKFWQWASDENKYIC